MPSQPPRLIDLHCDWILQYAGETTVFDPELYRGVERRVKQAEGYLGSTSAAIFSCFRRHEDWTGQANAWTALDALITRIEAEFPGRLLIGPEDHARWLDDPDGLAWGLIGVEGFDFLIRVEDDLAQLKRLFDRGVRLFQPVYTQASRLGGSSEAGDDRGLTELGKRFVETIGSLKSDSRIPLLDLAHLNPRSMSDVMTIMENDPSSLDRIALIYSHGALAHNEFSTPRALTLDNLKRLRSLGGTIGLSVGPPFYRSKEALKAGIEAIAEIPRLGEAGFNGIAIGTDFLGVDETLDGLSNVAEVVEWIGKTFSSTEAETLIAGTGRALIAKGVGL